MTDEAVQISITIKIARMKMERKIEKVIRREGIEEAIQG